MQPELATGRRLGPYRIETLLGEGAMGRVWRAVHESIGRQVAIKALKPAAAADASQVERFLAEARAVNLIRHENIVECEGLVQEKDGAAYVVMELLEGRTLGAAIAADGKFAPERAARVAAQIAEALAAAHDQGIVHRDLKPENVFLIRRAGSDDYVKVLDFGIARLRPDLGRIAATETGALVGTPAYMAPEQVRGDKATPASDVYALGVVLFQMLTGRLPLTATNMPLMFVATLHDTPPRADAVVGEVPRALADVIERALDKEPAARPDGMRSFRAELLAAAGIAGVEPAITTSARVTRERADALAPTIGPGDSAAPVIVAAPTVPGQSRRAPLLSAGLAIVALGAGALWIASRGDAPERGAVAELVDAGVIAKASPSPPPIGAGLDRIRAETMPSETSPAEEPVTPAKPAKPREKPRQKKVDAERTEVAATDEVEINARGAIKKRYASGLNVCWEMAHKIAPDLPRTARVKLELSIEASGRVANDFKISGLTWDQRGLEIDAITEERIREHIPECLDQQVAMWLFPEADHGVVLSLSLTLKSKR